MEGLQQLINGLVVALEPTNLMFALVGAALGTLVGVLPGIGSTATIALLLPVTFQLPVVPSIIMLTAIFYGSMYGGTITSVLVNMPGEVSSAITSVEGYQMARRGRAGAALFIAAVGSFIAGIAVTLLLVLVATPLSTLALRFGPPEFFSLMVLALLLTTGLAGRSMLRGLTSMCIGLLVGTVGSDPVYGVPRLTFGQVDLLDGVSVVPLVIGLFGVADILSNIDKPLGAPIALKMRSLFPTRKELSDSSLPIARGTAVGAMIGVIPGLGATIASAVSYLIEKKVSRTPGRFGTGMIEGVAGPESANNAAAGAAMIPLFALGIPGSSTIAIIMGAFLIHGVLPGPFLFVEKPEVVWPIIASFVVGNAMLLALNVPLIPLWVSLLKIPYSILFALILAISVIGTYSASASFLDVGLMILSGVVGFIFMKLDYPIVPLLMGFILGPLMEKALRQSLALSAGDYRIFVEHPISAVVLAVSALALLLATVSRFRGTPGTSTAT